jgi:ribose transport system substrate-binding protein
MAVRRRTFPALLAGVALLALAGCSGGRAAGSPGPVKIGFVVANSRLNFAKEMMYGFGTGVRQVPGVEYVATGPDIVDGSKELQLFQQLTSTCRAGVSVFTLSPELFADPLASARHAGVPLIAVDNPASAGSNVDLFIGNDNYQLGKMLADQVAAKLAPGTTGEILLGTSNPGVPVLDRRADGMRDELRSRLPGVTVLGPFDTKHEVAGNLAAWRLLVKANPHALAFLGTGDTDGWNLAAIRKATHGRWLAGAYDLDPKSLRAVKEGHLLLVSPEHFIKGALAGRLQAALAKTGQALPRGWLYTPGLDITAANIDEIIARQVTEKSREAWFRPIIAKVIADQAQYLRPLADAS